MFNPSSDLTAIQNLLMEDIKTLEFLDLTGSAMVKRVSDYKLKNPTNTLPTERIEKIIISQTIIKRSQWSDLVTSDKRLCIYFVPSRPTRNESFIEEGIMVDVHVPINQDHKAWEIQERVKIILHNTRINKRYTKFYGQLGELSTVQGFFCCGSRYRFYRSI